MIFPIPLAGMRLFFWGQGGEGRAQIGPWAANISCYPEIENGNVCGKTYKTSFPMPQFCKQIQRKQRGQTCSFPNIMASLLYKALFINMPYSLDRFWWLQNVGCLWPAVWRSCGTSPVPLCGRLFPRASPTLSGQHFRWVCSSASLFLLLDW